MVGSAIPIHNIHIREHTRQHKQNDPVNNQYWPEHGDIEDGQPRADETDGNGAGSRVPELELWQTADERSELLVLLGGQAGGSRVTVLETLILGKRGVELGSQEGKEEVQKIDSESIGDCNSNVSELFISTSATLPMDVVGFDGACASPSISISRGFIPIYQPCAKIMRRKKRNRSTPEPIQR